ncbi:hypothetical protein AB0953_22435 [Streptomyces sp. NPDC046866]|uniref:hypothetical protein n=1 Tax=Streptomyces sp. NPDC046866 TaxID=3154921 RepID=UPI003454BE88
MPGVRLLRWAVALVAVAGAALPVCAAGLHAGRPAGAPRPALFVGAVGHQARGDAEGSYAPLSVLAAPTVGLLSNTTAVEGVLFATARGARYVERSNVLHLPSGGWRYLPAGRSTSAVVLRDHAAARRQIAQSRAWLDSGRVPGRTPVQRTAAERALLSMRALLQPNGAVAAGWTPGWKYSWPRDASFVSAAFAHTGHDAEAYRILRHSAATQRRDGTWEARTKLDGSGPPDRRPWQLDANGWVPWAAWQWYQAAPRDTRRARLNALYPMVRKAADRAAASLRADGLPPPSPDYWELMTATPNIGTAAPLLAGLNASADLAREAGRPADAARWAGAARRLSAGIAARFAPLGYQRTVDGRHGYDSAVAFMAPPFNTAPAGLPRALDAAYKALLLPNGGLTPGNDPAAPWGGNAWTPSTSFFALAWAGTGRTAKAERVLDWVLSKRNALGELPEKVDRQGRPSSIAPLAWTGSIVVLSLVALDGAGTGTHTGAHTGAGAGAGLPTPPSPF